MAAILDFSNYKFYPHFSEGHPLQFFLKTSKKTKQLEKEPSLSTVTEVYQMTQLTINRRLPTTAKHLDTLRHSKFGLIPRPLSPLRCPTFGRCISAFLPWRALKPRFRLLVLFNFTLAHMEHGAETHTSWNWSDHGVIESGFVVESLWYLGVTPRQITLSFPITTRTPTVSVMRAISPFVIFAVFDVQVLKCCR